MERPIAQTEHGRVSGTYRNGVSIFRGIPYGAARRFAPPTKPDDWAGVRDCARNGPVAMQPGGSISLSEGLGDYFSGGRRSDFGDVPETKSEDCLVLNVLTPRADGAGRAVLVYLHGGGYSDGSGALVLGGELFVSEEDVVLVGVNHRLNVFGFLDLHELDPAYRESGAAGILDLVRALEWVRDNIASFGGDPARVTIMGESGGGGKVCSLLAMPCARGLFRAAIVESGSMPAGTVAPEEGAKNTRALLARLGLTGGDWRKILDLPAETILRAAYEGEPLRFDPAANGVSLPYNPGRDLAPEISKDIPLLVGSSEDEMAVFAPPEAFEITWETLPDALCARAGVKPEDAPKIIETYRAAGKPGGGPEHLFLFILSTLGLLGGGARLQAEAAAARGGAKVYHYLVKYDAPLPGRPGKRYAWHTADLPLQLRIVQHPESESLSKAYARAWGAFARTCDPSTPELPWPAYDLTTRSVMLFDDVCRAEPDPLRAVYALRLGVAAEDA